MIIGHVNNFDDVTVTDSTATVANLPVANVQVNPVGLVARFSAGTAFIEFDAGSSVAWRAFALLGTNLTPSATRRIRLSNTGPTTGDLLDTGDGSASVITGYPQLYHLATAEVSARYGRIDVADAGVSEIDIGRIFAGPVWEPTIDRSFGEAIRWQDRSDIEETLGGQDLVNQLPRRRIAQFGLEFNSASEMYSNALEIDRENGIATDVLVMLDPAGFRQQKSIWGRIIRSTDLTHWNLDTVRKLYSVKERL